MAVKLLLAALFFLAFPAKSFAAFTLEAITPTEITSENEEVTLFVSATNLSSSSQYIQAAITKEGKSNYFGFTQGSSGSWAKYDSSPDLNSLVSFTPVDGSWNGEVKAKLDTLDSGFTGPGTYLVKVLKYITASGVSSNSVPINVNITSTNQNPTPTQTQELQNATAQKKSPEVQISVPSNLKVGEEFEISYTLLNFEPGSYFVKARIGKDYSHLTLGQTYGSSWLGDTDSWSKFPQKTSSSKVKVRLSPYADPGSYQIRVRLKKTDSDKTYDSPESIATFKENPSPQTLSSKTTTAAPKSPAQTVKQQTGIILAASSKNSTVEAAINEHYKNIDVLGTSSADKEVKQGRVKKALNLLLAKKDQGLPVEGAAIVLGFLLVCGSVLFFIRRKSF